MTAKLAALHRWVATRLTASCQCLLVLSFLAGSVAAQDLDVEHHTVIRQVLLERQPIFSAEDKAKLPWLPLGFADAVHFDTLPKVIERELLFEPGEPLDPEELAETERKLRRLRIFGDVEVRALQAPGDSVDILVRTRELWTTDVNFKYKKYEDDVSWSAQLIEKNFLGTARRVELIRSEDIDRSSWTVGLSDPQLFAGRWAAGAWWSQRDDGKSVQWSVERPFFRLNDDWSLEIDYADIDSEPRYYLTSTRYVRPEGTFRKVAVAGMRRWTMDADAVWRIGMVAQLDDQKFESGAPLAVASPDGDLGFTADLDRAPRENRKWRTPALRLQRRTRRYEEVRYLFSMGEVEDIPRGIELDLDLGWTSRIFGSDESGLWFELEQSAFLRSSRHWLHGMSIYATGLVRDQGARDLRVHGEWSNYHDFRPGFTFASSFVAATGSQVDRNRLFGLGLESGLRAARFRELSGDRLLRANIELRAVYTPGLYDLITPGLVVFADHGTAWLEDERDFRWSQVRGAVGAGLRLGFNRGSADLPIRIDLAWPVFYPAEQSAPVLSIGTRHLF